MSRPIVHPHRRDLSWIVLLAALTAVGGCGDGPEVQGPYSGPSESDSPEQIEERFKAAIANMDRLEEFESNQMLRGSVKRIDEWVRSQPPLADWEPDPMLETLPREYAELPEVTGLGDLAISEADGEWLREVVWLRDIAAWAHGQQLDDLSRATALFDWTIRNIQIDSTPHVAQYPWETLRFGRGTAIERAWVFMLLARQQRIDAALLAVDRVSGPAPFAVGVLSGEDIYIFDPLLGLPIPAPDGIRLDGAGSLQIDPATLAQVVADPELLRRLDLGEQQPYLVGPEDLDHLVVLIEASPTYLAARMRIIESKLSGEERMVLSIDASGQAARWKALPEITDARLWFGPYQAIFEHRQWRVTAPQDATGAQSYSTSTLVLRDAYEPRRARVSHLKGHLTGPNGAIDLYRGLRKTDEQLDEWTNPKSAQIEKEIAEMRAATPDLSVDQATRIALEKGAVWKSALVRARLDANYWLGLVTMERGQHKAAIQWLEGQTPDAKPNGLWTAGALYNLGRCYEALGRYDEAIDQYMRNMDSDAQFGNLLRARWLNAHRPRPESSEKTEETSTPPSSGPDEEKASPALPPPALPPLAQPPIIP